MNAPLRPALTAPFYQPLAEPLSDEPDTVAALLAIIHTQFPA